MSEVICKGAMALKSNCGKCSKCYAEALLQLAALREELASANADKEAYAQNAIDLRTSLDAVTLNLSRVDNTLFKTSQRLADAERRNAVCAELLDEVLSEVPHGWGESFSESELAERIRAVLTKPEEAKS